MRKTAIISLCMLLLSSCIITKTPGFYIGYKGLTENEKNTIVLVNKDSSICNLYHDDKIYAVNGNQLLECLKKNDTSIVYTWGPNCSSEECILISACQEYCSSKNYNLYVIADYYDIKKMQAQNVSIFPMLIANHQYYKKEYANSLNRLFINDLLASENMHSNERAKRFLIFKGDKLINCESNLFKDK